MGQRVRLLHPAGSEAGDEVRINQEVVRFIWQHRDFAVGFEYLKLRLNVWTWDSKAYIRYADPLGPVSKTRNLASTQ